MDEIVNLFRHADADGSGALSFDELRTILLKIGTPEQDVPAIFAAADENHDGQVDYEEFVRWVFGQGMPVQETLIGSSASAANMMRRIADSLIAQGTTAEALFDATDLDQNRFLEKAEFFRILQTFDQNLTLSQLEACFARADCDQNGWVAREEFVASLNEAIRECHDNRPNNTENITVTVPAGVYPGQSVAVHHNGIEYHVVVPAGYYPGQSFVQAIQVSTAPPSVPVDPGYVNVQVVVPPGHYPGDAMNVTYNGQNYQVTIPDGCYPGWSYTQALQAC